MSRVCRVCCVAVLRDPEEVVPDCEEVLVFCEAVEVRRLCEEEAEDVPEERVADLFSCCVDELEACVAVLRVWVEEVVEEPLPVVLLVCADEEDEASIMATATIAAKMFIDLLMTLTF